MKCASVRLSLGAYVLGALGRRESRQIREHVAACRDCDAELSELTRLRPMLDQLSLQDLATDPEPLTVPRARGRVALAACLLLAVVAGGLVTVVAAWPGADGPSAVSAQPTAVALTDASTHVMVDAKMTARSSGTDIMISLRDATPGEWCWLVAVGQGGRMQRFESWEVTSRGEFSGTAHTGIRRSELTRLRIVRDDKTLLADLPVG